MRCAFTRALFGGVERGGRDDESLRGLYAILNFCNGPGLTSTRPGAMERQLEDVESSLQRATLCARAPKGEPSKKKRSLFRRGHGAPKRSDSFVKHASLCGAMWPWRLATRLFVLLRVDPDALGHTSGSFGGELAITTQRVASN